MIPKLVGGSYNLWCIAYTSPVILQGLSNAGVIHIYIYIFYVFFIFFFFPFSIFYWSHPCFQNRMHERMHDETLNISNNNRTLFWFSHGIESARVLTPKLRHRLSQLRSRSRGSSHHPVLTSFVSVSAITMWKVVDCYLFMNLLPNNFTIAGEFHCDGAQVVE